jgi:DNA-binding IclR family transcriptional regulator
MNDTAKRPALTRAPAKKRINGQIQSVDRAIDILKTFSLKEQELTLGQIAAKVGLSKPTAYRLIATMRQRGLISQREDTKAYSLGSEFLVFAAIRSRQSNLLDLAIPVIRRIRDQINETTSLAIRVGDFRVNMYQLESLQTVRRGAYSGEPSPLYAGASKLLLAAMSDTDIADYMKRTTFQSFTATTIADPELLWREIRKIRKNGYSESRHERFIGAVSLAAPVRDSVSGVVAALYASIPEERYTKALRQSCLDALLEGAARVSNELGYRE